MAMSTLLLVSGAGLPNWIWDGVTEGLSATIAARPASANASLEDHAKEALASAPPGPLTVVAHSAGGVVAAALTALAPERVAGLLAVSAVIPRPGRSFIGSMPLPNRLVLSAIMRLAGTRPPASAIRNGVASGVDEATTLRLVDDFAPESQRYYRDGVTNPQWPARRGYVTTTSDRELSASLQEQFAANLAPTFERRIGSGHLPMLERPDELRTALTDFERATSSLE